jgi:hypothetical protein
VTVGDWLDTDDLPEPIERRPRSQPIAERIAEHKEHPGLWRKWPTKARLAKLRTDLAYISGESAWEFLVALDVDGVERVWVRYVGPKGS